MKIFLSSWGVLVLLKFWQFWSELTKTWSSGTTECGVWIGNCNVKVWKSTEHKLHKIWCSLKFCVNPGKRAHPWVFSLLQQSIIHRFPTGDESHGKTEHCGSCITASSQRSGCVIYSDSLIMTSCLSFPISFTQWTLEISFGFVQIKSNPWNSRAASNVTFRGWQNKFDRDLSHSFSVAVRDFQQEVTPEEGS